MEEIEFDRKLKKAFKELDKKYEEEFIPCTVNLMKWCEVAGKPRHYNWIVNLITKKCEENEAYYDYLRLNSDFIVCLDKDGLFLFSDILADFFGLDNVRSLWQCMRDSDEYEHLFYDIEQCTHNFGDEELELLKDGYMHPKNEHEEEVCKRILGIINAEQERRKPLIIRKVNEVLKLKGIMRYDDGK